MLSRFAQLATIACLLAALAPAYAAAPKSEAILPDTAQGWGSAPDFQEFINRWDNTQLGKLLADPIMNGFVQDFRRDMKNRRDKNDANLELDWDDLKALAGGEVSIALVHPKNVRPVQVLLVDVAGNVAAADKRLADIGADLVKNEGATAQSVAAGPNKITVYMKKGAVRLVYFRLGDLVCLTRNVDVAKDVLARAVANGQTAGSLAALKPFQQVQKRLAEDLKIDAEPGQVTWFIQPLGFLAAREAMIAPPPDPNDKKKKDKTLSQYEILQKTGFEGLQGAGGLLSFDAKEYDILHRVAVYAPKPWKDSMNILSLVNDDGLAAPPWLTKNAATFTVLQAEGITAFDHFGPLFNERLGGGDKNRWQQTLASFRLPVNQGGLNLDVKGEIVEPLVRSRPGDAKAAPIGRAIIVTHNHEPITGDSERRLLAAEIFGTRVNGNGAVADRKAAEAKVAHAIDKLLEGDRQAGAARVHTKLVDGVKIWEMLPDPSEDEPVQVKIEGSGGVQPPPPAKKEEAEAMCVAHGHLIWASHLTYLVKVLKEAESKEFLADAADYKAVMNVLDAERKKRDWSHACLSRFMRTDEEFHGPYDLARVNKLHESRSMLARMIRNTPGFAGEKQPFDGRRLPAFQQVRSYFRPAGLVTHYEPDGFFLVTVTLKDNVSASAQAKPPADAPAK